MKMSMVVVVADGYIDVHGLSSNQTPWLLVGFILVSMTHTLEDMLMSVACAAAKGHNIIYGSCCNRVSCWWYPWSVLTSETMWMPISETYSSPWSMLLLQGRSFYSGIDDCILTVEKEDHGRLLWQILWALPMLLKSNSLERKTSKRTSKMVIRLPKCSCPQLMALAGVWVGKESVFFNGLLMESLTMFQWV